MGSRARKSGGGEQAPVAGGRPARSYRNFILDSRRRFIFAYVPKVACTNWKSVMRHLAGHADYLDNGKAHDKVNGGLHYLDLSGPEAELLQDPSVAKFAVVRNPYTRTLSAYLNKVVSGLSPTGVPEGTGYFADVVRAIEAFRQDQLGQTHARIDFEVFLLWLRSYGKVKDGFGHFRLDEHWQSQSVLLRHPEVRFDILGRFETLAQDAPRLLRAMGAEIPFPSQGDVKFRPTGADGRLASYLTPRCCRLINKQFAEDFAHYGYEMRRPNSCGPVDGSA